MQSIQHRSLQLALAATLGLLGPQALWAASPAASDPAAPDPFERYDKNGDKQISLAEFTALGGQEAVFKANDANGDGQLSAEEIGRTAPPADDKAHEDKAYK
jgi:hypothetical protein